MDSVVPSSFPEFRHRLSELASDTDAQSELAERFIAANYGKFPLVEGSTAHFIALAQQGFSARLTGDWNGGDIRSSIMEPLGAGLVHFEHDFEPDARIDYNLVYVAEHYAEKLENPRAWERIRPEGQRDPLNQRVGYAGGGERSELMMPEYKRPAVTIAQSQTPIGKLDQRMIVSTVLDQARYYSVYTPNSYDPNSAPYPTAYFHDGTDYLTMGFATEILDNMIASGAIPPMVAVFTPPEQRFEEYNCNLRYTDFFATELVGRIHRDYNVVDDPQKRAVIGPSMGGIISLYMGYKRPDVFRLVGAQSPVVHGFGRARFDARTSYLKPPAGFKLSLVIGSYEICFSVDRDGNCRDLRTNARELRDILQQRGYNLDFQELHQSHSWGLWRDTLPQTLSFLFSGS